MPRFIHSSEGYIKTLPIFRGGDRFCQILIIKQTEIAQIRPQNTYGGVTTELMYIYVDGGGGTEILPIPGGEGTRNLPILGGGGGGHPDFTGENSTPSNVF